MPYTLHLSWPIPILCLILLMGPMKVAITDLNTQFLDRQALNNFDLIEFDKVLALRRQAILINPYNAEAQLELAKIAKTLWFFRNTAELRREADTAFERASTLSPHWSIPHYEHARMYAFKKQYDRALSLLAPALQIDPNNAGFWLERARYLDDARRSELAKEAYKRCWEIDEVAECKASLLRLGGKL